MKRITRFFRLNAFTIASVYLILGIIWILFSDALLATIVQSPDIVASVQSLKGIFYVIVTALGLYFLIWTSNREYKQEKKLIDEALQAVNIATWEINLKSRETQASRNYYKILGLSKTTNEFRILKLYDIIHPEDKNKVKKAFIEAIKTQQPLKAVFRIMWPDKKVRWLRSEASVIKNNQGKAARIVGVIEDITKEKELELQKQRDTELFESIFENIPVMVDIYDPEINKIRVNKAFERILGWSNEEVQQIDLMEACYPEPEDRMKAARVMREADGSWHEFEVTTKEGERRYQEWANISLSDETIIGIGIDTTNLRRKERELKEITQRYREAEEIADLGHWERDLEDGTAIWSDGLFKITGIKPEELDTRFESILGKIHPDDREHFKMEYEKALKDGNLNVKYRMVNPETGDISYFRERAETEYDEEGNPVAIRGTVQDTTETELFQKELHARNIFIENTLENLPIGVSVNMIDSGKVTLMNKKFSEIYGWPEEVLTDLEHFFEVVYPDEKYRMKIKNQILKDIASGNPEQMSWKGIKITTKSGEERIVDAKNIPVYDQNLMISTVMDVTAREKAEKKLAQSEHHYRLLFEKSPQPMWIYDPEDLSIVKVNQAATRKYGYSKDEFENMTLLDIRPEEEYKKLKTAISKDMKSPLSDESEWRHKTKSGEIMYVTVTGSAIDYYGNAYRLVLVNDITEQKKAEERVISSFVEGENKERSRMARELHDGLGQYLAAANMNLDSIQDTIRELEELSDSKKSKFDSGLNYLKHAINETSTISHNLVPRVVEDYGLVLSVTSMVDNYRKNTDINFNFYENIEDVELSSEQALNLYRVIQEALSNAVKYSEASQINIQLIKDNLDMILTIDDDGVGFDKSNPDFTPGLGLQTIRTRAGALGGDLEVDSRTGRGTMINLVLPLNQHKDI